MTVGQVAAGSSGVGPRAAFAPATAGLGSNPRKDPAFPLPAEADGKSFSFHFTVSSDEAPAGKSLPERNASRRGEAFGVSRETAQDTPQEKEQPEAAAPGQLAGLTATPLAPTALETARRIIEKLQMSSQAPGEVGEAGSGSQTEAAEPTPADPLALFLDRGKPGDVFHAAASHGVEWRGQALVPRATIELTSADNDAISIQRLEQGIGRTFSEPGPHARDTDLAALLGSVRSAREMQPNPVENSRVRATTEVLERVAALALTTGEADNPNHRAALPWFTGRSDVSGTSESARQYQDPEQLDPGQSPETAATAARQMKIAVDSWLRNLDKVSLQDNQISSSLKTTYLTKLLHSSGTPAAAASGPSSHSEQFSKAQAVQSNIPTRKAGADSWPRNAAVPMDPSGNALARAASLPIAAARFSLRPAAQRGYEGVRTEVRNLQFSTSNPQAGVAHQADRADLELADTASQTQSKDTGSGQQPRNIRSRAADNFLVEIDSKAARVGSREAETVPARSLSMSAQGRPAAAASPGAFSSGAAGPARPIWSAHAAPEAARPREGQAPSSTHPRVLTAFDSTRAEANLASSRQPAAPATGTEANLASSRQPATPLSGVIRRERGQQDGRSRPGLAQIHQGQDSPEQPESQSVLLEAAVSKRHARASRGNEPGQPFPNPHSDSERSAPTRATALPAVHRSADNALDPASQGLLRPADSSLRAPTALSRPADTGARVQDSHLEQVRAVERVVELASLQKNADSNQMNIVLRDSQLGRISLRLVERNGLIGTIVRTDSSLTGRLIGENLPQMLESLSHKGFDVSQHGNGQWSGSQQEQRQGGRQRPPRPPNRQGQHGPGAGHVFRLEIDS